MSINQTSKISNVVYKRIATEEAFAPRELLDAYTRILSNKNVDPGFNKLWGFYMTSPSDRARHIMNCLEDLDALRISHMDATGIDIQVLAMTSPGVQIMDKASAVSFIPLANNMLHDAIKRHPTRFAGMISIAPQDPSFSAKEIQRGVQSLGMNAVVINSHTHGEYLSDPKFWEIFEAAQAFDIPIYIHPNSLPAQMVQPFLEAGLDGAIYGFGVETGLHALRIMTSGALDRFPNLQIILGHMGEALPYLAYRLDYMHAATVKSKRYDSVKPTKKTPSEYLKSNFHITNSGVAWEPAIKFAQSFMGEDRVLYAMDYPFQYSLEEVNILDAMDMPIELKTKFFQTNAEKLFKLI